ncbi:tRNA-dihydrouridine synthase 4 [Pelomyxa schiedti]|nr:tRNA-dihydrouridine synthase 4 [Pelomyxa schiedti]
MVRYSRLPFRLLARKWGCDVAFTPMFVAKEFVRSQQARDADFSTNAQDHPLVVQFASHDEVEFSHAAELVASQCEAIDLNCGCPQSWVIREGCGSALGKNPELICRMVSAARSRVSLPISVKMRKNPDISATVETARQIEHAGASFITLHGRTANQRDSEPCDYDTIKLVRSSVHIPVIANGGVRTREQAEYVSRHTGCAGVMAANGILRNPAFFQGFPVTPTECISDWITLGEQHQVPWSQFQYHLYAMWKPSLVKTERAHLSSLSTIPAVREFLQTKVGEL